MNMDVPAVELRNLRASIPVQGVHKPVINDVSLTLGRGEALGLVGESGSGKSMTARALVRLLPPTTAVTGKVLVGGRDVYALGSTELRRLRARVGFIFQDPRAHINPVHTIGDFLIEAQTRVRGLPRDDARKAAISALDDVGVGDARRRLGQYPHELSGGLLQRVMIASTLLMEPEVILADEATTALDVTTQADVVAILSELRRERGVALLFITHDLDLAAAICDRTAVMYAGQIVEDHDSATLHEGALHPYTRALAAARPPLGEPVRRLEAIPGRPIAPSEAPAGCAFAPRCRYALDVCRTALPELRPVERQRVRCIRAEEIRRDPAAAAVAS